MTERQSVIAYLKARKVKDPVDEVEEHVNMVLSYIINQIERGAHRVVEGKIRR